MTTLVLLFIAAFACRAEVIDRIAVVVGNGVITESEILREIRLTAFLEGRAARLQSGCQAEDGRADGGAAAPFR